MKTLLRPFILVLLTLCLLIVIPGCKTESGGPTIFIENGKIKLGFDRLDGSLSKKAIYPFSKSTLLMATKRRRRKNHPEYLVLEKV